VIRVGASSRRGGIGLFASENIPSKTVVACDLVLVVPDAVPKKLRRYVFGWTKGRIGVVMGPISWCNHAVKPNAEVTFGHSVKKRWAANLTTTREVLAGEEITIDYGREYWREMKARPR
jgi:SET domain-containing protein